MLNFQLILDALDKYAEQTGTNLKENPFAEKVRGCDSPNSILLLLQENVKVFKDYRDQNRKFIDCLSPVIQFVHAFSAIFGEAAGLVPFQPAKLIFVGINVLFTAAEGVSASYDALLELFECVGSFLKRLEIYTKIPLSPLMTEIIAKIMVELLSILAQAKKQVKQGRFKQFAKKLLGDSEIESIMRRLDRLTQDEARMMDAHILEVVYGLMSNMKVVMDGGEASTSAIRKTLVTMQDVANEINKMNRDRLHEKSRNWLSPPDPSENQVIARRENLDGSAVWFTRGSTFENWNANGCLLWIHGKPGSGKSILWWAPPYTLLEYPIHINICRPVPPLSRRLWPYVTRDWARLHSTTSTSEIRQSRTSVVYCRLSSCNSAQSQIHATKSFLASIPPAIMDRGCPMTKRLPNA
ncbi:hypothetical protein EDB89DRAFT_1454340 [Lactarius sanguifluus]|nr:hypothetical protein EDB89DRAFT_1454340 [Lactarius sanguifluus]